MRPAGNHLADHRPHGGSAALAAAGRTATVAANLLLLLALASAPAAAVEKTIVLDDLPALQGAFDVAPDGQRLYFSTNRDIVALDRQGQLAQRFPAYAPRGCVPLADGRFVVFESHAKGRIAIFRADGSEERVLVARRGGRQGLRPDGTGWTSPTGGAVDQQAGLIFALDVTMAPRDDRNLPDPDWSRIAIFDLDGQFVRDLHAFSAYAKDNLEVDANRTWYDGIAVDAARQRVYVTARRDGHVLAFTYAGQALARQPGVGPLAVFPDGRVATLASNRQAIAIYPPAAFDLHLPAPGADGLTRAPAPTADALDLEEGPPPGQPLHLAQAGVVDVGTDAAGQLYASLNDLAIAFVRWSADLATREEFGPRYLRLRADFPNQSVEAGSLLRLPVWQAGRPPAGENDGWHAWLRPADGSELSWRSLACQVEAGVAAVPLPEELTGLYELALSFGSQVIPVAEPEQAPCLAAPLMLRPPGLAGLSVLVDGRRQAFQIGEDIPFQVVARRTPAATTATPVTLNLVDGAGRVALTTGTELTTQAAWQIPAAVSRRLAPGDYTLTASADGWPSWPASLTLVPAVADSPMQRLQYHEFGGASPFDHLNAVRGIPERLALLRNYAAEMARLGFTRQTDRLGNRFVDATPAAWPAAAPVDLSHPACPPPAYFPWPAGNWEVEFYLDQAVRHGLRYDTQMLSHCDGVKFRDYHLNRFVPALQRLTQWLGRSPAFHGFNYNDEMFFGGWAQGWTEDDVAWLKQVREEKFAGRPHPEHLFHAMRTMYDAFNAAVRLAAPAARLTTTPMWQFPAVEGSYAPVIYEGMDETYSHYLSEGYHFPWYPAHSVNFLKRPGLPAIGVFDNNYGYRDSDGYLQDLMQVLGCGAQGVGVQHANPWEDPFGADSYRVGNELAKRYGAIYAEAEPLHEGAILYAYTQDIAERRNSLGTPQWERVFELHGAGRMADLPMRIVYEEDIVAGTLLAAGRPLVPMVFLVGLSQRLPPPVEEALRRYVEAGGRLFADSATTAYAAAQDGPPAAGLAPVALPFDTHGLRQIYHEGNDSDAQYPLSQPVFERLATALRAAVGPFRHFPIDTDHPWIAASAFAGGGATYIHLASDEGAHLPWPANQVWGLGTLYRRTTTPKTTRLSFPFADGVVYDVFERRLVEVEATAGRATLAADLRTLPGRLYAVLPKAIAAPALSTTMLADGRLDCQVQIVDANGAAVAARVPLRLRLHQGGAAALDVYRGTDAHGQFGESFWLPVGGPTWTLEASELLSGRRSTAELAPLSLAAGLAPRPAVDIGAGEALEALLAQRAGADESGRTVALLADASLPLDAEQRRRLAEACRQRGLTLAESATLPDMPAPGVFLAVDVVQGGQLRHPLLAKANAMGLLPTQVGEFHPGPGRGLVAVAFAPRARDEHVVALIGGDAAGLAKAVDRFAAGQFAASASESQAAVAVQIAGRPAATSDLPKLSDHLGSRLDQIVATPDGRFLAVSASGYLGNLAIVEDLGQQARPIRATRLGHGPQTTGLWIADDGTQFGASLRVVARHGNEFRLANATDDGQTEGFASFGDQGRTLRRFGIAGDGQTVVAPGPYGAVAWRRQGGVWQEAWRHESWRHFDTLDWPVADLDQRNPDSQALIPRAADFVLLLASEKTNNGWIKPEYPGAAELRCLALADGQERWRFEVPLPNQLLFPTLFAAADGRHLLLQVQVGSWREEHYRFYCLDAAGQRLGDWRTGQGQAAIAATVADHTGHVAVACAGRRLEVRRPDGSLHWNLIWPHQPISLAFDPQGETLYVADDAGKLTCFAADGQVRWQATPGCVSRLAATPRGVVAAGWDGRLRAFAADGAERWTLDCTPPMLAAEATQETTQTRRPKTPPTTTPDIPTTPNLLATGQATLTVGGTRGWKSSGTVQTTAADLTNGQTDDGDTPWLTLTELFWAATGGRQVWAEIAFAQPTDVATLTVHENPNHPDAWPTDAVVQQWNDADNRWQTVRYGAFLVGPVNTYRLDLKNVAKLRYVPLGNYFNNLHTSEIEVR